MTPAEALAEVARYQRINGVPSAEAVEVLRRELADLALRRMADDARALGLDYRLTTPSRIVVQEYDGNPYAPEVPPCR